MALLNSATGYGSLTKAFHWVAAALFAFQLFSGPVMVRMEEGARVMGLDGDALFNWHKTIGLAALLVATGRLLARRAGELPPWAPCLGEAEREVVHRAEGVLYAAMFVLPASGFVYVMAGGYGVLLAGVVPLPNPIGRWEALAVAGQVVHVVAAIALVAALAAHLAIVGRHTIWRRDALLRRMLP